MFRIFAVVLGFLVATTAFAQSRCDCDEIVGQCQATIKEVSTNGPGARFKLQANTEQCSIVEWSVDGDRGMTTIWDDGEEVSRVSPRKAGGSIKVHSCRICKDQLKPDRPTGSNDLSQCKQYEVSDRSGTMTVDVVRDLFKTKSGITTADLIKQYRSYKLRAVDIEQDVARRNNAPLDDMYFQQKRQKVEQELGREIPSLSRLFECVERSM